VPFIAEAKDDITADQVEQMYAKEKRLDGAAVELFLALREKYGQRLRATGGLIFCGKPDIAEEIQPTTLELMLEANDILDEMDLSAYGIAELQGKERMNLIRRAVTGTSVYIFSADEHAQSVVKLLPDHKDTYCKVMIDSSNEIRAAKKK